MGKPEVTVLMTVYNGEQYIRTAISSILYQKFKEFELLIINDGSTDRTAKILDTYAKKDSRVRVVHHKKNIGIAPRLNEGLKEAKAEFIARMDSDDKSLPERLGFQLEKMKNNSKLVLCASGFNVINNHNRVIDTKYVPYYDDDLRRAMWLRNPIAHGSVMYRKGAVLEAGGYREDVGPTEDYDLWLRLGSIGEIMAFPRVLFQFRINEKGISLTNHDEQMGRSTKSIYDRWQRSHPDLVTRQQVIERSKQYAGFTPIEYGIGMKKQMLSDVVQVGMKLIKRRRYLRGINQLIIVASTGRTGLKILLKRIRSLDSGSFKAAA